MIKIPFPAFTVCETGSSSYSDSTLIAYWLDHFNFPIFVMLTEVGLCRTVNFCFEENFLRDDVDNKRIFQYYQAYNIDWLKGQTQPLKTYSPELGVETTIENNDFYTFFKTKGNSSYKLMIHSAFELPTKRNQIFYVADMDYDTFWVTPQLNTIDDTMISMDPEE